MVYQRWIHSDTVVFNIGYHLAWCTKYRRKVLIEDVENRLSELLMQKTGEIQIQIEEMKVMPDHVRLFVKSTPVNSPHYIVRQFKDHTANVLRKEFPYLLKMPSLWTRSYYCESVGQISEELILKYLEGQKKK